MKKLVLMMVGLFLFSASYAQDKEALKAQKEAIKEAEKVVKKARTNYELSIPNPQYGRKETDFTKLAECLPMIESATTNQYSKGEAQTWKTAADVMFEYYKKQENETKADPDNEALKSQYIETCEKLLTYCVNYDSLMRLNPKAKEPELKAEHAKYQPMGLNSALQLLQVAQGLSNSDKQDELKKGAAYSELFINAMNSSLLADYKGDQRNNYIEYAKAFRAQSYYNIEGTPESTIVAVYEDMMNTQYKSMAYQYLANYFREKDADKYAKYLQQGIDALKSDPKQHDMCGNYAIMLMQHHFQKGNKDAFKQVVALIKNEFSDNSNAVNAYLMEGQMAFEDKQYDEAKAIFLAAKEKFPDESKCLLMAARCAWMKAQTNGSKKADMDEAIKMFKQLESENPDDSELWGESLYILYNNTQQPALAAPYKKYYKPSK